MNSIPINVGIKGFVKIEAVNAETGERRLLSDWFPNTILDSGLAIMDTRSDWMTWCQVGTSNDAPDQLQTSLQGWVAGTNQVESTVTGAEITAPFFGKKEKVFRFPASGLPNQILNEVGVGWGSGDIAGTGVGDIISRALIVDITGTQISPSWKTGELLDVTYQLRYYPPLVDVTGDITVDGVLYNYILRAAEATDTAAWASNIGAAMGQVSLFTSDWSAYDGDISADIDGLPSGLSAACDNADQFNIPVGSPPYTVGMGVNCGSTGWNLVAFLRSLRIKTTAGNYQIQFTADAGEATAGDPIPKDTNFTMAGQFNLTWAEGTIPP